MATGRSGFADREKAFLVAFALGVLLFLWLSPRADAEIGFCPPGSGAGQCGAPTTLNSPRGLATDQETGRLYVADKDNNRVDVFKVEAGEVKFEFAFGWKVNASTPEEKLQTCTIATGCLKGSAGAGAGQFDKPITVAVDNDIASPSHHAIYVGDSSNQRVQKFDPSGAFVWTVGKGVNKTVPADLCTAASGHTCGAGADSSAEGGFASGPLVGTGPGGVLYAVDNLSLPGDVVKQRLQRFQPSGVIIPPQAFLFEGTLKSARALAVDPAGNAWVSSQGEGLRKYSTAGALLAGPIDAAIEFRFGLTADPAGTIYAAQNVARDKGGGSFNAVSAYSAAGGVLRRFAYTRQDNGPFNGLATYASALGDLFYSEEAAGIKYIALPPPGPVAAPPSLEAIGLGSTKATLFAEVNPEGKPTSVHFEYLTQAEFEAQGDSFSGAATKSTPTESLGAEGFDLKAFERQIGCPNPAVEAGLPGNQCLTPDTAYRWRTVATNSDGGGEGTVEGPAFETKESLEIRDTYATEVGSDAARLHAEVNPLSIPATGFFEYVDDEHFQADIAEGGDGFAGASKAPAGAPLDFGAGEAFATRSISVYPLQPGTIYHYRIVADDAVIAPVAGEEEVLRTFEPAGAEACANEASRIGPGALLPDCRAYELVSPLDKGGDGIRVLKADLGAPGVLEQSADSGEKLAYGSLRSFGGALSAPYTSQYIARRVAGEEWETHSINSPREKPIVLVAGQTDTEVKAFSADLCDAWVDTLAEPPLAAGALAGFSNLYRRHDRLCGAEGYEALAPIVVPENDDFFEAAVQGLSADGSRAIFIYDHKLDPKGTEGQPQLYEKAPGLAPRLVCVLPNGDGVSGSCTAGSATVSALPGPLAGPISEDGERIFWSAPGGGQGKLYVRIGGTQTVAVSKEAEEAAGTSASWFWGAAADGSRAIFSTGNLNGQAELYEFDVEGDTTSGPLAEGVIGVMGISADAKRVYFASVKAIAGSGENSEGEEAEAGEPNLYLREAGGGTSFIATLAGGDLTENVSAESYLDRTARVSPDGAHAAFASVAPLTGYDNKGAGSGLATKEIYRYDAVTEKLICASCNPSGARPSGPASIPGFATPIHAPRVLSADGKRLYFESVDRLAARDTNGKVDVYQWEEAGAGGCDEADPGFSAAAEGCIELISTGQSPVDSRFVESNPSGDDLFFATLSGLLPQDYGLLDIYDARVGGGLPTPPAPAPPCEGDACQPAAATPEAQTPAGETYSAPPEARRSGQGSKPRCAKGERRVQRKGKARCVPKRKKQRHHRRAGR